MRIALLTHHWVPNDGANLQAIATSHFLNKLGHDVTVLNYRPKALEDFYANTVPAAQIDVHNHLCDTYLRQSPLLRSENEIIKLCQDSKFDVIISGSDVIFRLARTVTTHEGKFPSPFWMEWASSALRPKPRIGFLAGSASGSNYYFFPHKLKRDIRDILLKADYVSVRDRWTRRVLLWVTLGKCRPKICPDPVSVFNDVFNIPDNYKTEQEKLHKKYILLTIRQGRVSDSWINEFVNLAHANSLQVFSLPLPEGELKMPVDRIIPLPLSPLNWYTWIQHAAGYIGELFHTIVCCTFNNVPFISVDNNIKTYFDFINIRMASKVYDLCTNVKTQSYCINPRKMHKLDAKRAFKILQNWDSSPIEQYATKAKSDFAITINELLG